MRTKRDFRGLALAFLLFLVPVLGLYAQNSGSLEGAIDNWADRLETIGKSVIGLAAIGGGIYTYFKVQSDDGGSGKKAIGNYIIGLVFGAVLFMIIDFFFS